ncbi:class I SAM-dependent methyltransferase [Chroococcus sp. FPU101]|uniref:class I SAM-dependent methyltransferase n=1 Tax=Chroococcus sp. FPU101 TaxID=1974212 RepID=UPI001A9097D7|nr:class I SAM-dependent methyltransferase [Chroococcus sp. FPU101]GFE71851.1 Methyltransferase type 11 [Chroococcus sp. FPU101]
MTYFASDFKNVDGTDSSQKFVQCLKLQQSLESYYRYKHKTFEQMHLMSGASVLEIGCGTGEDAITLAKLVGTKGKVTAVDHSQMMLNQALASTENLGLPIEFILADAQQLPFADQIFEAARVDRTLQHIANPQSALAEMARVVRPGGWVVAIEPDWGTFVLDSEQRPLTRQLLNLWCDSFPCGWIGRHLFRYFRQVGLSDLQVNPETIVFTEFELADQVLSLVQTAHKAVESGMTSQPEIENWLSELQQFAQSQQFFCSFIVFIVSGKKLSIASQGS